MIYTPMTNKALKICFDAHKDQVDKAGAPYVFHPFHLAEQMDDEASTCAALLHDVVEDTDATFDDLLAQGISYEVVEAVRYLTHEDDVPYMDYVANIASNPIAVKVKFADLKHNMERGRFDNPDEVGEGRIAKYKAALELLS
ncbi:HD domain-containing protein [Adlercreutzia sp. ZJ141]|uniref:HD domain-containing protein n=1 Tax=Adlercreutzia sp. ZJ141 TaxID=2709406 RepID=UPI0013EC1E6F|nr:HD domain-containing protein [Adlercreutzia sp. ZJ141]